MSSPCKGTDCSANQEIHVGDIGTVIRVTVNNCVSGTTTPLDISAATSTKIIFKSPSGTVKTMTAAFTTDGTDGQIEYILQAGDLDETGYWKIQSEVVLPSGTWRSDIGSFQVYENL